MLSISHGSLIRIRDIDFCMYVKWLIPKIEYLLELLYKCHHSCMKEAEESGKAQLSNARNAALSDQSSLGLPLSLPVT